MEIKMGNTKRQLYEAPYARDLNMRIVEGQHARDQSWCNPGSTPFNYSCNPTGLSPGTGYDICSTGTSVILLCTSGSFVAACIAGTAFNPTTHHCSPGATD